MGALLIAVVPHGHCRIDELTRTLGELLPKGYKCLVVPYKVQYSVDELSGAQPEFRFFVIPDANAIDAPCEVLSIAAIKDLLTSIEDASEGK